MTAAVTEAATATDETTGRSKAASDGRFDDEESLDEDELFHLLKNERRRRTLRYLLETDEETIIMRDVAEAVAAEEYDTTVAALGSGERQRVYITLYQSHLPQLADAGVITYDQSRGHITTTPLIEAFEPYLYTDSGEDDGAESRLWVACAGFGLGTVATLVLLQVLGPVAVLAVVLLVVTATIATGVRRWVGHPEPESADGSTQPSPEQ